MGTTHWVVMTLDFIYTICVWLKSAYEIIEKFYTQNVNGLLEPTSWNGTFLTKWVISNKLTTCTQYVE